MARTTAPSLGLCVQASPDLMVRFGHDVNQSAVQPIKISVLKHQVVCRRESVIGGGDQVIINLRSMSARLVGGWMDGLGGRWVGGGKWLRGETNCDGWITRWMDGRLAA